MSRAVEYAVILGCPRSGTSFLADALRALPSSECLFGGHLPVTVPQLVARGISREAYDALAFGFRHALENHVKTVENSRHAAFGRWLGGDASVADPWRALRRSRFVERVVYKEPFLAFAPRLAFDALPGSRLLYVLRDGRDCADSLVRTHDVLTDEKLATLETAEAPLGRRHDHRFVPWWVEPGREVEFLELSPYARAAWFWRACVERCWPFFHDPDVVSTGRVLVVRYEDLVRDSLGAAGRILAHLGATLDKRLERRFSRAHPGSVGAYRRRTPAEIDDAERVARRELELCGYL